MFTQHIDWATGNEPCVSHRDIFDSRFLTDFDPDDYLEEHEGASEIEIKKNEVVYLVSQNMFIREAKSLCERCPALQQCREWVLEEETDKKKIFGVVGGLTEDERLSIRQENAKS